MQLDIFFNTINLSGDTLLRAKQQVSRQDERIIEIMKGAEKMTPLQVSRVYNQIYPKCPETSIRRSMTSLTDRGILEMLDEMVIEKYGRPNHFWKVVENNLE